MDDVPGYRDLQVIGRGGFSTVYRAWHERLERTVAVKVIDRDCRDSRALRRFRRECQLAGRLAVHPHVVAVLDTGVTPTGRPYLVMEHYSGGSVADRLAAQGRLEAGEALRLAAQVAGALAAAHACGVLHRDVKPENVLLSEHGDAALGDFGVAQLVEAVEGTTRTEALTPCHAAPELLDGGEASAATDVYALGSTLYQMLAGRPAFQRAPDEGIAPLLLRIMSEDPPPISRADLPESLRGLLRNAMARRPADRPSVIELHAALREAGERTSGAVRPWDVLNTATDAVRNDTVLRPGRQLAGPVAADLPRRRRWPWLVLAGVLGAAAGGAAMLYAQPDPAHPAPAPPAVTGRGASPPSVVPDAVLAAARPTALVVEDHGASVTLRWRPGRDASFPLFAQRSPGPDGHPQLVPVPNTSTSATMDGLDRTLGYCFQVGAVVRFGQPSIVAWSGWSCIRGAHVIPTAASPAGTT